MRFALCGSIERGFLCQGVRRIGKLQEEGRRKKRDGNFGPRVFCLPSELQTVRKRPKRKRSRKNHPRKHLQRHPKKLPRKPKSHLPSLKVHSYWDWGLRVGARVSQRIDSLDTEKQVQYEISRHFLHCDTVSGGERLHFDLIGVKYHVPFFILLISRRS